MMKHTDKKDFNLRVTEFGRFKFLLPYLDQLYQTGVLGYLPSIQKSITEAKYFGDIIIQESDKTGYLEMLFKLVKEDAEKSKYPDTTHVISVFFDFLVDVEDSLNERPAIQKFIRKWVKIKKKEIGSESSTKKELEVPALSFKDIFKDPAYAEKLILALQSVKSELLSDDKKWRGSQSQFIALLQQLQEKDKLRTFDNSRHKKLHRTDYYRAFCTEFTMPNINNLNILPGIKTITSIGSYLP